MSQQNHITSLIFSTIDVLNKQEVKGFINVDALKYFSVLVKMYNLSLIQYNYRETNSKVKYDKTLTNLKGLREKIDCVYKNTDIKKSRDKFYNTYPIDFIGELPPEY